MIPNDTKVLSDLDRAFEAGERGDYAAAERWTSLAERKLAMARKAFEIARENGLTPELLKTMFEK